MSNYLEMAASHLAEAGKAADREKFKPGRSLQERGDARSEYGRHMELAREWAKLAAIDKGIAFPADPGEDGQPS